MSDTLDPAVRVKEAILKEGVASTDRLLAEYPELITPALWPIAIYQARSLPITKLLIERGLNPNECSAPRLPLHLAAYQVLPAIVDALLRAGADPRVVNRLDERPLDLLEAFEPRPVGDPDVARVRDLLVAAGAHPDFLVHVRLGDVQAVEHLLTAGAAIPASALHAAARSTRHKAAALLLRQGADPDRLNEMGNTPLWFAAQSTSRQTADRITVMELLLDADAQIDRRCEEGTTALHCAAWRGSVEVLEFLLSRGADPQIKDAKARTALERAIECAVAEDKKAIARLLG